MLDQADTLAAQEAEQACADYDLVVVGAGIAGLNALYAATDYLHKNAKVLLIDQKPMAGGMWSIAYDYVRLHQPHPMFTVGDMKWNWNRPRDYLAKRDEVRSHLASALGAISKVVTLETAFGQTVTACEEVRTDKGYQAKVSFHSNLDPKDQKTVTAARVIYAPGLNYREAQPLSLSSNQVVSIIPQELLRTLTAHPDVPIYVIGGGKTGMDTVLATLAKDPQRKVSLVNGRGTNFLNRTKYIPTGLTRWTSGQLVSRLFRDLALNFDGDNEDQTIAYFRKNYATDANSPNGVFLYGLQSEEERSRIDAGLEETYADYLVDVVDRARGPEMQLRDSSIISVPPGSIFVNCTGSFFRATDMDQALPCISPHETVMSINARDGFHFLTSVAGFFVTHLLYRGALKRKGFYTLDHEALFRQNRNAWVGASAAQAYMNQVVAVQTLPLKLLDRCGLDLDRWYPFPRRMIGLVQMKASATNDIAHCRAALDRVTNRFGVHYGPIE